MFYRIGLKKSAEKDLDRIHWSVVFKILGVVESLKNSPFPHGVRKITGTEGVFRIRFGGDYRVIYHVDVENKIITIYYARYLREAYRGF